MNALDLLHFLKERHLIRQAQRASLILEKVLNQCLDASDEQVSIVTDYGSPESVSAPLLGGAYYLAAQSLGMTVKVAVQEQKQKGECASIQIERLLEESGHENIIIMAVNSLGSTPQIGRSFRKFSRSRKHKFLSCTGLGSLPTGQFSALLHAINVDYSLLEKHALAVKKLLDQAKEIHITTPAGTELWMDVRNKKAVENHGNYAQPGHGGNLPAGEVYLAPRKKQVEGTVVIDGSSRNTGGTTVPKVPLVLTIENGEVTDIQGGEAAVLLEESLEWAEEMSRFPWGIRRVGEFGLGLNPNASVVGAMIIDEKTRGTGHIALGSNHWFGGTVYALTHLDQVFRNPTIELDGEVLDKKLYI